jgi:hypothetical protein
MERNNMKIIDTNFDILTGETIVTERDETPSETKSRLDRAKEVEKEHFEAQAKETARAAILERLGLTADDAAVLLG